MHSTPLPPLYPPALPLIGTSSVPPASMHPPLPHDLILQAPPPLQPQTASPALHLLSLLQCPQVQTPGGPRTCVFVSQCVCVCVGACGRLRACGRAGGRAGGRASACVRVRVTRAHACVLGGKRCEFALSRAAPAPAGTARRRRYGASAGIGHARALHGGAGCLPCSARDGFEQAVPIET